MIKKKLLNSLKVVHRTLILWGNWIVLSLQGKILRNTEETKRALTWMVAHRLVASLTAWPKWMLDQLTATKAASCVFFYNFCADCGWRARRWPCIGHNHGPGCRKRCSEETQATLKNLRHLLFTNTEHWCTAHFTSLWHSVGCEKIVALLTLNGITWHCASWCNILLCPAECTQRRILHWLRNVSEVMEI